LNLLRLSKALPQGSKTAFVVKGKAVMTEAEKGLVVERKKLSKWITEQLVDTDWIPPAKSKPVIIQAAFSFERPKTVKREHHTVKPNVDKLTRYLLNAITQSGLIDDDAQVVAITAMKEYGERDFNLVQGQSR
jgi:Holliday junction resolvase RusA-like endonuclease